ncbi:hypothetical protein D2182_06700 [Escherichia coli]|nr:hypothetical protein D2182_06700 [Escherichia coli]
MDSVHHIWCPLFSQEFQDLPDGAETTLTDVLPYGYTPPYRCDSSDVQPLYLMLFWSQYFHAVAITS